MAIFTFLGGLISSALFGGALLATKLIAAGLALATQLAVSYLNRPKKRSYSAVQGQVQYGADVPAGTAFGMSKVKGQRVFYAKYGKGNKFNAEVFALANGWCDGLEPEIYFYGVKHTLIPRPIIDNEVAHYGVGDFGNLISIRFYDGRPGQGPDTKLVSDTANLGKIWKVTSVGTGICYVVVERQWNEDKFKHGRPEFEFILRGLREYDPRFDSTAGGSGPQRLNDPATWAWTENPAIHRLNYVLGVKGRVSGRTLIGMGKPISAIDLGSHIASANVCDATRKGKKTYACSLYVQADDDHTEILREIEDAMAGYGMNRYGLSGVLAGAPQLPVMNIGPMDIRGDEGKQITPRKSAFELFNSLSGQFTSKESHWKPESLKTVTVNADIATDGRRREGGNDFLQVTDPDIAQYLLSIRYRQQRKGGAIKLPVSRRAGLKAEIGSWITFEGKTWLVTGRGFDGKLRFTLHLSETGAEIYDDEDIEPGPIIIPPIPPVNPSLLTTVQNFRIEAGMITGADGYEKPVLRMTWEPPEDPTITMVRFEYGVQGGVEKYTAQTAEVESGEFVTGDNVVPGEIYIAHATIVTVPDRFKTWTGWVTTSTVTGAMSITAYLKNIGQDVYRTIQALRADYSLLAERMEILAAGTADATGASSEMHTVTRKFRNATAIALREMTASIEAKTQVYRQPTPPTGNLVDGDIWIDTSADNFVRVWNAALQQWEDAGAKGLLTFAQPTAPTASNVGDLWIDTDDDNKLYRWSGTAWVDISDERITAQASILDAVRAQVGEISADGLRKIEVVAGTGDVVARLVDMVRASIADDWVEAGTVTEVGFEGGDPLLPFSRIVQYANQHVFADANGEWPPVVIDETGTGWFNRLHIKDLDATNITADKIDAALILQNGSVIEDLIDVDTFSRFEPIQYSDTRTVAGGQTYSEPNWTLHGTVIIDKPADKPCIEFMSVEAYANLSGSGGRDAYIRVTRGGNGTVGSGEDVVKARMQGNGSVTDSKTIMRGGLLNETSIRYDIWTRNSCAAGGSSNATISVKCDSGVWVFR